jgi:hypothetical protein
MFTKKTRLLKNRVFFTVIRGDKKRHGTESGADVNSEYKVMSATRSRHERNVDAAVTRTIFESGNSKKLIYASCMFLVLCKFSALCEQIQGLFKVV